MAIIRNFRLPIGVGISSDYIETFGVIQSTSPNTGAIVSRGGVGVGNSISIAGRLQLFNGANYTSFVSSASGNTLYTLPATSPATGSSILQSTSAGVMSWVPMVPNFSVSAGTATTATYAHQSGYAITSGFASTASYSYQSGYGITAGFATTSSYSYQSGYGITAGLATTATYSHQSGYAITSGSSGAWTTPRTLNLSGDLSGSVIWSGSGDTTLNATIVANSVALGTDTTGQYASTISISGSGITATASNADDSTAYTIYSSATASNTVSSIVSRDGSGNFSAGIITANLTGTATTAINLNVVAAATNATHYILFSPGNGGSGVAVSSDAGLFFNPGSNTLTTTTFAAGSAVNTVTASVSGSTASTSTSTGALIVTGGVGIGQSLNTSSSYASSISGVVANNGVITSGSWAGSTITVNYGGTGYSTYTKGDLIVGAGSTFIKVGIGASHQVLSYSATAASGLGWTDLSLSSSISTCYGAFYSTQTQQVYGANTITPITLNNTYEAANVQIYGGAGTSSRIQINSTGVFNIQFSAQINLASGTQTKVGDFWFRIDGTDVPFSNTKMSVNGKDFHSVIALNFVSTFTKGQYFELMMNSADSNFLLEGIGASTGPVRPATPSMIVSVTKVL
jgi:hypothetical protein